MKPGKMVMKLEAPYSPVFYHRAPFGGLQQHEHQLSYTEINNGPFCYTIIHRTNPTCTNLCLSFHFIAISYQTAPRHMQLEMAINHIHIYTHTHLPLLH